MTSPLRANLPILSAAFGKGWQVLLLLLAVSPQYGCTQEMSWKAVDRLIQSQFPQVEQISTDTLARWMSAPDIQPILLDVRTAQEYAVSHLPGAIRIDPDAPDLGLVDSLDASRPIVTYCSVGYRSSALAAKLAENGHTEIYNLKGSIFRWANEGRRVVRDGAPVRAVHPYDALWGKLLDTDLHANPPEQAPE